MGGEDNADDVRAIEALIARQFGSPDAALFPSARPARPQGVPDFIAHAGSVAHEPPRVQRARARTRVRVFGNVAVALAACENMENETMVTRNVEALLLTKDGGARRIAAQAWDNANAGRPVPADLTKMSRAT